MEHFKYKLNHAALGDSEMKVINMLLNNTLSLSLQVNCYQMSIILIIILLILGHVAILIYKIIAIYNYREI